MKTQDFFGTHYAYRNNVCTRLFWKRHVCFAISFVSGCPCGQQYEYPLAMLTDTKAE